MMSELLLDPRQEIFELIDKESGKYQHIQPYVSFDETTGCINGCCVNGLVMLKMGWNPKKGENNFPKNEWNSLIDRMEARYGVGTHRDINLVNANSSGWKEAKRQLADMWGIPPT